MACSAAALATPVFTTASRPLPKSTRGVPGVGGPAARRRPARSLAPRASADAASAATALSWPEGAGAAEIGTTKATASVVNLGARGEIATGLPFLDHMIDQLTSHAQLGVSVVVSRDGVASVPCVDASGTDEQDEAVARAAGAALGQALAQTLAPGVAAVAAGAAGSAEFAAPLDEAYSTCVLAVPCFRCLFRVAALRAGALRPRGLERPRAHRHVQDGSDGAVLVGARDAREPRRDPFEAPRRQRAPHRRGDVQGVRAVHESVHGPDRG
jgi:imidazoleglycerol-phosphate dehydratase